MRKIVYICVITFFLIILCVGLEKIISKDTMHKNANQEKENSEFKQGKFNSSKEKKSYSLEKIHLQIQENSISKTGITLIITDNNEKNVPWEDGYKIQRKISEKWIEIKPKKKLITSAFSYWKDENNQYIQKINWSYYYGELENGKYRIVKPFNINKDINLYSDEFEIKEQ